MQRKHATTHEKGSGVLRRVVPFWSRPAFLSSKGVSNHQSDFHRLGSTLKAFTGGWLAREGKQKNGSGTTLCKTFKLKGRRQRWEGCINHLSCFTP